jgi:hypothetical protein
MNTLILISATALNPSIERARPDKSGRASHVKR